MNRFVRFMSPDQHEINIPVVRPFSPNCHIQWQRRGQFKCIIAGYGYDADIIMAIQGQEPYRMKLHLIRQKYMLAVCYLSFTSQIFFFFFFETNNMAEQKMNGNMFITHVLTTPTTETIKY